MCFELVLFDLDGTLIETAPEIADAVNDTLRELALPEVELSRVRDWIGHGTGELLVQALAHVGQRSADALRLAPEFAAAKQCFDGHYRQRCGTRSHLYPQVREVLNALRQAGLKLALVTNKEQRYTRAVLDAHQLAPLFDRVISGDSFPLKKPDPVGVLSCLEQFAVLPGRALFVGDSCIDVATARAAGVTVWALPYGYNMGKPIQDCGPDRVIEDFSALMALTTGRQKNLQTV
jgi:phosphoglycolate phosphatase